MALALPAAPEWVVAAHISVGVGTGVRPRLSIMTHPVDATYDEDRNDAMVEQARAALSAERSVLTVQQETALALRIYDPMAAAIGGHLLAMEIERGARRLAQLLDGSEEAKRRKDEIDRRRRLVSKAAKRLRYWLGDDDPDAAALEMMADGTAVSTRVLSRPPVFRRSVALLTDLAGAPVAPMKPEVRGSFATTIATPLYHAWGRLEAAAS
jgi:hypothetical protein